MVRLALGWYRALVMTGLYTADKNSDFDPLNVASYVPALKRCVDDHPILSVAIHGLHTETPVFVRPAQLDMRNHVQIIDLKSASYECGEDELEVVRQVTLDVHDKPWENVETIPPWKIVVFPLPDAIDSTKIRIYILYTYSHTHGDGKSALAFHKSFLRGLQQNNIDDTLVYKPNSTPLPLSLESLCKLHVSWSFLLSPVLAQYLPATMCQWLGLRVGGTQLPTEKVYLGETIRYEENDFRTGSQILLVKKDFLAKTLTVCRSQQSRLTGLLNQLVVLALRKNLPPATATGFIAQIVLDLRHLVPEISDGATMGNFVSVMYETSSAPHKLDDYDSDFKYDDEFWHAVRGTTSRLAAAANTLKDQPIGLLKYLSNFRSWFLSHLGKKRESSYEISNVGVFDPRSPNGSDQPQTPGINEGTGQWNIERMIFSQPANVTAAPLNLQVVTIKGSDMVLTLNWQLGILGVPNEDVFAQRVLRHINDGISAIASFAS